MMAMPHGGLDNRPAPPQAQPQFRPQDRGGWQGGSRGPGAGAPWQGRVDVPVSRPQPSPAAVEARPDRGQWRHDARGDNRPDVQGNDNHRWDGNRSQWNGGDRRPDAGNDHRWDNRGRGQWNGGDRRAGTGNDHRWDRDNRGSSNNNDHRWDRRQGGNHRWDASRWRNDHRYDWRDWRNSHRNLFRRHYYAPHGYRYHSVYAGFFLEPLFYSSSYWLDDPFEYRLPPVEWPLHWVHYYNDALLVDVTTGEVVDVIPDFFLY